MSNQPKRLHPLHSIAMIADSIAISGEYFDSNRRTGRSTALALKYIADAIARPYTPIKIIDHEQGSGLPATLASNRDLSHKVFCMIRALGLKYFRCNGQECTVTFGTVHPQTVAPNAPQAAPPMPPKAPPFPSPQATMTAWEKAFFEQRAGRGIFGAPYGGLKK